MKRYPRTTFGLMEKDFYLYAAKQTRSVWQEHGNDCVQVHFNAEYRTAAFHTA
jgi:hypothetical protein